MRQTHPHAAIIARWPTQAEFARAIGATPSNARNMMRQGIPATRFNATVEANAKAGFEPITYARLAELARRTDSASAEQPAPSEASQGAPHG